MPGNFKHDLTGETARRSSFAKFVAIGFAVGATCLGAAAPFRPAPPFRQLAPLPSVRAAAKAAGISLAGWATGEPRTEIRTGDSVTLLVSLTHGDDLKQWIIEMEAQDATEAEKAKPHSRIRTFSNTGHELKIDGYNQPVRIRIIGPLEEGDAFPSSTKADVKTQRVIVNGDFLSLGLARVPEMMLQFAALRRTNPNLPVVNMNFADHPFAAEVIARERRAAAGFGVSAEDERAFIGSFVALIEFAQLTAKTPGVKDLFIKVVDVPWWAIVTSGGKLDLVLNSNAEPTELAPSPWGLPAKNKVFASPFVLNINGKPAVILQLAVTAPNPPLSVSAGIIGMAAVAPNGKGPVMTFQVVASRAAKP